MAAILITFSVAIFVMMAGFIFSTLRNYYSIVDVLWAYTFTIVALALNVSFSANLALQALSVVVVLWSLRLGSHLLIRLLKHYPIEDGRYLDLKKNWSQNLSRNFLLFYIFQAVSVVFLGTPLILVASDSTAQMGITMYLGMIISILGWVGESIADRQLARFRSDAKNKGQVCQVGFWQYSRHPNYFFEWTIWVGFAVAATDVDFGYLAWVSPITMFYLLNYVTGVPYAEAQSMKSRGEAFVNYQKSTNIFFPGPRRKILGS